MYKFTIQGTGFYNNNQVVIIDSHKDKLLIITDHNPIEMQWVKYTEIERVTWIIDTNTCAA